MSCQGSPGFIRQSFNGTRTDLMPKCSTGTAEVVVWKLPHNVNLLVSRSRPHSSYAWIIVHLHWLTPTQIPIPIPWNAIVSGSRSVQTFTNVYVILVGSINTFALKKYFADDLYANVDDWNYWLLFDHLKNWFIFSLSIHVLYSLTKWKKESHFRVYFCYSCIREPEVRIILIFLPLLFSWYSC